MTVQLTEAETRAVARRLLDAWYDAHRPPSVIPRGYASWAEYMASLPPCGERGKSRAVPAPDPIVLIGATSPRTDQVPASARRLCEAARAAGWHVRATYALAEVPAHVRVTAEGVSRSVDAELIETLAVRLAAPAGWPVRPAGYALWRNGSFHRAYLGGARYQARHLLQYVKGD